MRGKGEAIIVQTPIYARELHCKQWQKGVETT